MQTIRWLSGFVAAALATAALSSVFQTQYNLTRIAALDQPMPFTLRLVTMMQDLLHFAPTYAIIVAAGFLIAFAVAGSLSAVFPRQRGWLYPAAGFVAVLSALLIMSAMLPVTAISAARSGLGMFFLSLFGAVGAWLHASITAR
ncbi:MAG: hypothetical protein EA370_04265 [Wenzhouxiangella sp.]|nr:MAG: hypothetical protein EA370_04265 [Wenzhouxiangella sp.]